MVEIKPVFNWRLSFGIAIRSRDWPLVPPFTISSSFYLGFKQVEPNRASYKLAERESHKLRFGKLAAGKGQFFEEED